MASAAPHETAEVEGARAVSEEQPQYSREDLEQMGLDEREINAYLNDADSDGGSDGDEGDEDGEAVAVGADGDAADDGSADDDAGPGGRLRRIGAEEEAGRQPGARKSLSDDGDNPGAAPDVVTDTGRYRPLRAAADARRWRSGHRGMDGEASWNPSTTRWTIWMKGDVRRHGPGRHARCAPEAARRACSDRRQGGRNQAAAQRNSEMYQDACDGYLATKSGLLFAGNRRRMAALNDAIREVAQSKDAAGKSYSWLLAQAGKGCRR